MSDMAVYSFESDAVTQRRLNRIYLSALLLVMAAGAFLRFWNLGHHSLWLDEAWLAKTLVTSTNLSDVVFKGHGPPNSTPFLTSIFIHYLTRMFGGSEFVLRFIPALFSIGAIAAIYGLVRELGGMRPTALLAAGFTAIHPVAIFYAQELKQYAGDTFWLPLFMIMTLAFVRRPGWRSAIALSVGGILALGFSQIVILAYPGAAMFLFLSAIRRKKDSERGVSRPKMVQSLMVIAIWICVSLLLYHFILQHQSSNSLLRFWRRLFPASAWPSDLWPHVSTQMWKFFTWFFGSRPSWAAIGAAVGIAYLLIRRLSMTFLHIVVLWLFALGMSVVHVFPFGAERVNLYMFPMVVCAAVFGVEAFARVIGSIVAFPPLRLRWFAKRGDVVANVLVLVFLVFISCVRAPGAFRKQLSSPKGKEELRPLVEELYAGFKEGDLVIVLDGGTKQAFDYYTRDRPFDYHMLNSKNKKKDAVVRSIEKLAEGHGRVWIPITRLSRRFSNRLFEMLAEKWPSLVVFDRYGARLARFDERPELRHLSASEFDVVVPNRENQASKLKDGDPKSRWSSKGPRQGGWHIDVQLAQPTDVRIITLTAPTNPKDWSSELHVSYELSSGDGWHSEGVTVFEAPRTVFYFDPSVGPVRSVRIVNFETVGKYHWSIHELDIWTTAQADNATTRSMPSDD